MYTGKKFTTQSLEKYFVKPLYTVKIVENSHHSKKFVKLTHLALTVWKNTIKRDQAQKFTWNHLFGNFFGKIVDLTE